MRLGDLDALKKALDTIKQTGYDTENEPLFDYVELPDLIKVIDNAPTVEPKKEIVPVCKVTFDKEQLQEIVDKAKAEILASIERPQGEWKNVGFMVCECNNCKEQFHELEANNYCPNCGADMRGGEE